LLEYNWMIPTSGVELEAALGYLEDCLDQRQEMAADIKRGMREVDNLLGVYRAELRRIFEAATA
jgi:hypothetical protein